MKIKKQDMKNLIEVIKEANSINFRSGKDVKDIELKLDDIIKELDKYEAPVNYFERLKT